MNMLHEFILDFILVVFPILVYFIYNCYRELRCEKYNSILLNISLFSSIYLCLKYGNTTNIINYIIFSNIPILLAYLKRQPQVGILISIITLYYAQKTYQHDITLMAINLSCYLLIYLISKKYNLKDNKFIIITTIIQGFFLSFEYSYHLKDTSIITIIKLLIIMFIFYLVPFILLYLFKLTDNITNLYQNVSKYEKEKQIKDSLFKITHEVKNPIAVCKGYLEMMNLQNIPQTKKYIDIINQEINRSLDIMNDFMELGKIKINKEIIDINVLLDDISNCLKILIINKNIDFLYNSNDDERYIEGDYNRLKQVLINLLKNSIESINTSGEIQLSSYETKEYYVVEVKDNGIGMDEETLRRIKDMFYTTKRKGTGLGVTLSNEIIEAHGGTLEYKSIVGKYTQATIKIPKYFF